MKNENLYRLMDVLDEIKQIDDLISKHLELTKSDSSFMIDQYEARKEQLLAYFINELNSSAEYRNFRLSIIKLTMERFYTKSNKNTENQVMDKNLNSLVKALTV